MAHILFSISAMYINNEIECEQRDLVGNGFMNSHYIISTEPATCTCINRSCAIFSNSEYLQYGAQRPSKCYSQGTSNCS